MGSTRSSLLAVASSPDQREDTDSENRHTGGLGYGVVLESVVRYRGSGVRRSSDVACRVASRGAGSCRQEVFVRARTDVGRVEDAYSELVHLSHGGRGSGEVRIEE